MLLLLFLSTVGSQELTTPSSLLIPRDFNHHAYQYYFESLPEPTKQGPVLFPNDAPPPPRPPLIVTSRPLSESIARSELNNSIAESTQIKPEFRLKPEYRVKPEFRLKPEYRAKDRFLARVKEYQPFVLSTPVPDYEYDMSDKPIYRIDSRYGDYEVHTPLPPIYKVFADHAKQKVLKLKHKVNPHQYNYHHKPESAQRYQHNDVRDDGEEDYDHASNYAFSYRVKDHKTGDDFSHSQHSSGSATNGEYRVRLPDGRMQIVSYTADENGYKADVRYDDEGKAPINTIDRKYEPINYEKYDLENNNKYDINERPISIYNYVQNRNYKIETTTHRAPIKEEYSQYTDLSKEYYGNDYSLEYDGKDDNYGPHKSKFSAFAAKGSKLGTIVVPHKQNFVSSTTVKPSYEELKPLFVNKNFYAVPTQNYLSNVEINVPSTTANPLEFEGTTEHVVVIGTPKPNLYTNIRNVPLTATPNTVTPSNFVTPRNYLVSTIANLKNGQKPVLSGSFIDRINKYLTFT